MAFDICIDGTFWRMYSCQHLFETKGFPPKIILLRVGNMNKKMAEQIILQAKAAILDLENSDCGLLEIV